MASNVITILPQATADSDEGRLQGRHFPIKFPENHDASKRKHPTKRCKICNFTQQQRAHYAMPGPSLQVKYTTFTCNKCEDIPMCVTPCFELFHTEAHYRKSALEYRMATEM